MFCRFCGTETGNQNRFCHNCGKPLAEHTPQDRQPAEAKKKRGWIVAGATVVVLLAAVMAVLFWRGRVAGRPGGQNAEAPGGAQNTKVSDDPQRTAAPDEKDIEPAAEKGKYLRAEQINYDENGDITTQSFYEYDQNGRMTRISNYSGGAIFNIMDYSYEETTQGLLRLGVCSQENGTARSEELLDSEGRVISAKYFNPDGSCYSWSSTEYDEAGRILRMEQYDENGNITSGIRYSYDFNGNQIRFESYSDIYQGSTTWELNAIHYDNGYIQSAECTSNEKTYKILYNYTYFPSGKRERVEMRDENEESRSVLVYDESGNVLRQEDYMNGLSTLIERSYDEHGNPLSLKRTSQGRILLWEEYRYIKAD